MIDVLDKILSNTGDFIVEMEKPEETTIKRGRFLIIMKFNYYNRADFDCNDMALKLFRTLRSIYDVVRWETFRNDNIPSYYQPGMVYRNERCVDIALEMNWNRGLGEFLVFIERLLSYESLIYDVSVSFWNGNYYRILTRTPLTVNYINRENTDILHNLATYFRLPFEHEEEINKARRHNDNVQRLMTLYVQRIIEDAERVGVFNGKPLKRERYGV